MSINQSSVYPPLIPGIDKPATWFSNGLTNPLNSPIVVTTIEEGGAGFNLTDGLIDNKALQRVKQETNWPHRLPKKPVPSN